MKTCPNCKNAVNDNELFCPNCGTRVDAQQQTPDVGAGYQQAPQNDPQPTYQQDYNQQYNQQYDQQYNNQYNQQGYYAPQPINHGLNTTPYLVWSILNILFCCWPLSIWSLILSINANKKPTLELAQADLKKAKTICLIATIGGAVFYAIYFVLILISAMAESGAFY